MSGPQFEAFRFVTPAGRFVSGDLSTKRTVDMQNRPKPPEKQDFYFGLAIPKNDPKTAEFLTGVYQNAVASTARLPNIAAMLPRGFVGKDQGGFRWKIKDGDQPDQNGKSNENTRGCWVIHFTTTLPIKACNGMQGNVEIDPKQIERGYYIDVAGNCSFNGLMDANAGLYMNPQIVRLLGYGERIIGGLTPEQAFGNVPAQQVGSQTPVAPAGGMPGFPMPGQPQPGFGGPQVQQPANYPPQQPGYLPQPMPQGYPPQPGALPYPNTGTPPYGQPAYQPGYAPSAAAPQPAPAMAPYAMTLPPSTAYPSSPGLPAPGFPGGPAVAPPPGNMPYATGYPINPGTGQPVQPMPQFLNPSR